MEYAIWYTIEMEKLQIAHLGSVACWFLLTKFSFTEVETTQKSGISIIDTSWVMVHFCENVKILAVTR